MHFGMKNTLKSNRNHTPKQAFMILPSLLLLHMNMFGNAVELCF
jgi:hypothetical protein